MNVKGFIIKVKMMRETQRDYYAYRTKELFFKAKKLEKSVDDDLITIAKMFQ